jgi:peptidoglycan/xylan/chitin deacetylase (PgdA/CDA1 family)
MKVSQYVLFFIIFPFCIKAIDIAITIDDYPMSDGVIFSTKERTEAFLKACDYYHCKVAFFCIGQDCKKEKSNYYLSQINDHGHFLANHSMSHYHLSSQSLAEFEFEVKETEAILTPYKNMRKWFRYPFLDYGERVAIGGSNEKALKSLELLKQWGYTEGYVTINTFDWHIDKRLSEAIKQNQPINYHALKELYLTLVGKWCRYYIELYQAKFPGVVTHTLLLHANDLNALYLQDILHMIQKSEWNIISPTVAFADLNWRKKIFESFDLITQKPPSMDCHEIDILLKTYKVFSN